MKYKKRILFIFGFLSIFLLTSCELSLPFMHIDRESSQTETTTGGNNTTTVTTTTNGSNLNIEFNDMTYVFDGTIKKPTITGDLPNGVDVVYDYSNLSDKVGVYLVSADFTNAEEYNLEKMYARVTITKKTIDFSALDFENEFPYDGNMHNVYLNSKLPAHAHISYANNARTEVGQTEVSVTLYADSGYEDCFEGLGEYIVYLVISN